MIKATLTNLSAAKQENLKQALFLEFSNHPLLDAKVANIVKQAGISRGAFYTYFDDIYDAYQWAAQLIFTDIHTQLKSEDEQIAQTKAFLQHATTRPDYNFLKHHFTVNAAIIAQRIPENHAKQLRHLRSDATDSAIQAWLIQQSVHRLVADFFLHPEAQAEIMATLTTLAKWQERETTCS
ncbi:TetR family transcriptional regulator [Leuconostoc holzapfelii]|uniref:TetR family transcriptional regulator n=1 Tax=Leuconostoc holzapfelii TaxID=434464 RepID=A0ABT2NWT8_9LACO|nr:TetR family transcriptional regulator [Leuconostoc holzapfelii]MCT8389832.1 TetR family transcriptional regulator [Leuconostoc holzapfelii]